MSNYKVIPLLTEKETAAVNILNGAVSQRYWILAKVRLSEFFYSAREYGTQEFFAEFNKLNAVTLPVVIFDSLEKRPSAVVFFDSSAPEDFLKSLGVAVVTICELREVLTHPALSCFFDE